MFTQDQIQRFLEGTADDQLQNAMLASLNSDPDGQVGTELKRLESIANKLLGAKLSQFDTALEELEELESKPLPRPKLSEEIVVRVREIVRDYAEILAEAAPDADGNRQRSLTSSVLLALTSEAARGNDFWKTVEQIAINKFYDRLTTSLGAIPAELDVKAAYPPDAVEKDLQEVKNTLCSRLPEILNQPEEVIRNVVDIAFDNSDPRSVLSELSETSDTDIPLAVFDSMVMQMPVIFRLN